jgi:hypothetical protein
MAIIPPNENGPLDAGHFCIGTGLSEFGCGEGRFTELDKKPPPHRAAPLFTFPPPERSPTRVEFGLHRSKEPFNWRRLRVIVALCLVFEPI